MVTIAGVCGSVLNHFKNLSNKREAVLMCAVVLAHAVAIMSAFFSSIAMVKGIDSNRALTISLHAGSISKADPSVQQISETPQEDKQAGVKQPERSVRKDGPSFVDSPREIVQMQPSGNTAPGVSARTGTPASQLSMPFDQRTVVESMGGMENNGQDKFSSNAGMSHSSRLDLPPSSRLTYVTRSVRNGGEVKLGKGSVLWQSGRRSFSVIGDFDVQNSNILHFRSEGSIDQASGLKPGMYVEMRNNQEHASTRFIRDQNTAVFALPSSSLPPGAHALSIDGSELDPASAILQLTNLGRYDSTTFVAGAGFEMKVAGPKGMEIWHMRVIGLEEVETPMGRMNAWHLARTSEPRSDGQVLEIWYAPDKDWFPAKLRYSNEDGSHVEMQVSEIIAVPND